MSDPHFRSRTQSYRQSQRSYVVGLILASALTLVPFVVVAAKALSALWLLWIIGLFGLAQVMVHIRYFLHVDLSREHREELYLLLFSGALLALMIAGMLWILFNMYWRMM